MLEVVQGHARVGAAGQDLVKLDGDPRDPVETGGPGPSGQVHQVAGPAAGVANAQAGEPALQQLGDLVVLEEPASVHRDRLLKGG